MSFLGEFKESKAVLNKGLQIACEVNDRFGIAWVEINNSNFSFWEGDRDNTIDHANKAIKTNEEAGSNITLGYSWTILGGGYYLLGEHELAKNHTEKGLKLQKDIGIPILLPLSYWFLSLIHSALGDLEQARRCAEESVKLCQEFKTKAFEGMAWAALGSVKGRMGTLLIEEAKDDIHRGLVMLEKANARALSAQGYLNLGELFADLGCKEDALQNLKKAEALYLDMKVTPKSYWLTRTRVALAKLVSTQ